MDETIMANILMYAYAALAAFQPADQELDTFDENSTPEEADKLFLIKRAIRGAAPALLGMIVELSVALTKGSSQNDDRLN